MGRILGIRVIYKQTEWKKWAWLMGKGGANCTSTKNPLPIVNL